MNKPYKPQGYASVSVYIMADGAQRLIDFLTKTFDARETRRMEQPDGSIRHTELQVDDTVVMLADAAEAYPAFPVWLHVYVLDVDATYKRALAAGGISVQEPVQLEGEPDRRGGVKDPCGNTWWIATQVS
jgi:PhnB protein